MTKDRRVSVAVMMGGISSEREVSLHSGQGIVSGLRQAGFDVFQAVVADESLASIRGQSFDVVFIALHGGFGEDGRLQALLEDARIAYVGSGPQASHDAMDKVVTKRKFIDAGVPTAPYVVLDAMPGPAAAADVFTRLGPRVVVKPAAQGSSIGVSIVEMDRFQPAVAEAISFDGRVIIEPFIKGRELTVGILGERALPVIELKPRREFFDYTAKYQSGQTDYVVNPDLPDDLRRRISAAALNAFLCLGCRDLARVDVMLDENGDFFVLEVNTIPGFTETSLVPKAAKAVGLDFPALCTRLVEMAMEGAAASRPA